MISLDYNEPIVPSQFVDIFKNLWELKMRLEYYLPTVCQESCRVQDSETESKLKK